MSSVVTPFGCRSRIGAIVVRSRETRHSELPGPRCRWRKNFEPRTDVAELASRWAQGLAKRRTGAVSLRSCCESGIRTSHTRALCRMPIRTDGRADEATQAGKPTATLVPRGRPSSGCGTPSVGCSRRAGADARPLDALLTSPQPSAQRRASALRRKVHHRVAALPQPPHHRRNEIGTVHERRQASRRTEETYRLSCGRAATRAKTS